MPPAQRSACAGRTRAWLTGRGVRTIVLVLSVVAFVAVQILAREVTSNALRYMDHVPQRQSQEVAYGWPIRIIEIRTNKWPAKADQEPSVPRHYSQAFHVKNGKVSVSVLHSRQTAWTSIAVSWPWIIQFVSLVPVLAAFLAGVEWRVRLVLRRPPRVQPS